MGLQRRQSAREESHIRNRVLTGPTASKMSSGECPGVGVASEEIFPCMV